MNGDEESTGAPATPGREDELAWSVSGVRAERTVGVEAPPRQPPPRHHVLAAAAAALVLVALVAALSGGLPARVRGSSGGLSAQSLLSDAAAVVLALTLGGLCLLVYDAWGSRRPRRRPVRPRRPRLRRPQLDSELLVVPVVLGATVALLLALELAGFGARPTRLRAPGGGSTSTRIVDAARGGAGGAVSVDGLALTIAAAVLLAMSAALMWRARRRRSPTPPADPTEALAAAVSSSLEDLDAEPDPRRAVIRAYDRMERALAASGTGRHRAETPLEYLHRALAAVAATQHSIRRLTNLFEQARFSSHTIDAAMKQEAIDALTALRSELDTAARSAT